MMKFLRAQTFFGLKTNHLNYLLKLVSISCMQAGILVGPFGMHLQNRAAILSKHSFGTRQLQLPPGLVHGPTSATHGSPRLSDNKI